MSFIKTKEALKNVGIISKIRKQNLMGRSGCGFPTAKKWELVEKAPGEKKYVICNGSEGEPGVFKDGYLLKNHFEEVMKGVETATDLLKAEKAFIYLKKNYYKKFKDEVKRFNSSVEMIPFEKKGGYLAGEETSICNAIEGRDPLPRLKPPYPTTEGLWGQPTLVNNVETFFCVYKIKKGDYEKRRFYSVSGDVENEGVFHLEENLSAKEVLKQTDNLPDFDFFAQIGGGAIGEFVSKDEMEKKVKGAGAVIVFKSNENDPLQLAQDLARFFLKENCDRCVPCREGVYRMKELLQKEDLNKGVLQDIFFVLEECSLCGLGRGVPLPFKSIMSLDE